MSLGVFGSNSNKWDYKNLPPSMGVSMFAIHWDGATFDYTFEYLRVHSPSAEVKGHGPGQETLQTGKENVAITAIEPIGHYAVRLVFDLESGR